MDENLMNEQVESAAGQGSESPVPSADSEQSAETSSAASDTETGDDAAPAADAEQQEQQTLSEITGTVTVDNLYDRPIMTTPFAEYTVVEALLLLSLLLGLVRTLFRIWNN